MIPDPATIEVAAVWIKPYIHHTPVLTINNILSCILVFLMCQFPVFLHSQEYYIAENYFIKDISSCDIDLDGDNDLVISSSGNGEPDSIYFFYNDGVGHLDKVSILRDNGIFIHCGKIDEDPFPDIITKNGSDILFIKNNGDGSFGNEVSIAPSQSYRIISYLQDMDGDGLNDLVYTYSGMYRKWGILKNEGNVVFTDYVIFDDGLGGTIQLSLGMLNNDSLADLSLVYTMDGIHVLINNGDFSFESFLLCPLTAQSKICNLNFTLLEDVMVISQNQEEIWLYENLGNNEFSLRSTLPFIGPVIIGDITDFNNDGYDDYCYAICWWTGCTDSIYISMNDTQWSFLLPLQFYIGTIQTIGVEATDLNGDDYNDIVIYGYSPRSAFKILWNDGSGGFTFENPVGIKNDFNYLNRIKMEAKPNPFHSSVSFTIKSTVDSELSIYIIDLFGRIVNVLESRLILTDNHMEINWNGKDNSGVEVVKGIYYVVVTDNENIYNPVKIIKY